MGLFLYPVKHHLFYKACFLIGWKSKSQVLAKLSTFSLLIELCDPYWSRILSAKFRYEIEVEYCIKKLMDKYDLAFVDCGANIGYWTMFVGSSCRNLQLICVEPNPEMNHFLNLNLAINKLEAKVFESAIGRTISKSTNSYIDFYQKNSRGGHAGSGIIPGEYGVAKIIRIPFKSLDEILCSISQKSARILVKLDVEGVELECMRNLSPTFFRQTLFLYEDHGKDPLCKPTKWLLESKKYQIFFLTKNGFMQIVSIDQLRKLKRNRKKGYNILAVPESKYFRDFAEIV